MPPVSVIILHREPPAAAGPLERLVADARAEVADRQARRFRRAGARDVSLVSGPPDEVAFGTRLRELLPPRGRRRGLVVLGSGSIPLARGRDLRRFVRAAASKERRALANNRYSADIVAIARADRLRRVPALPGDNALPRWLDEVAGWRVADLRERWRLQVDLDGPLDVFLATHHRDLAGRGAAAARRIGAVASLLADRRAEVVVAGRTGTRTIRWLEAKAAARIRALVEERGLRASSPLALDQGGAPEVGFRPFAPRPPRSVLGLLLDREGPGALGRVLAELGDAALVDTRVLLAHRLGPDEADWPSAEDRFASDLLDPTSIADPWLRSLTTAALTAPIPVLLGGHTLVGPGARLVAGVVRGVDPTGHPGAT